MADTILEPTEIVADSLVVLHNKLALCNNINKEYDSRFAREGAKIGDQLTVRVPNQFTIREGEYIDTQDVTGRILPRVQVESFYQDLGQASSGSFSHDSHFGL